MVTNELRGERVDVVPFSDDPVELIQNALAPARVREVRLDDETGTATVVVSDYQLSLAIGKEGQNARLAARLTGWRIDIKSETQLEEEESGYAGQEWAEGEWVENETGEMSGSRRRWRRHLGRRVDPQSRGAGRDRRDGTDRHLGHCDFRRHRWTEAPSNDAAQPADEQTETPAEVVEVAGSAEGETHSPRSDLRWLPVEGPGRRVGPGRSPARRVTDSQPGWSGPWGLALFGLAGLFSPRPPSPGLRRAFRTPIAVADLDRLEVELPAMCLERTARAQGQTVAPSGGAAPDVRG